MPVKSNKGIINHDILIHYLQYWFLQYWFGSSSSAHNLLSSFLSDHFQTVMASNSKSQPVLLDYGIPQGSMLGPILYTLYTTPLLSIIPKYLSICSHFYTDDTQIHLSLTHELASVFSVFETCIRDIFAWIVSKSLSVNLNKTESLLSDQKHFNNPNCNIKIDSKIILSNDSAKNLRVIFQSDMSLDKHISVIVKSRFHQFLNFHCIHPFIPKRQKVIS